MTITNTATLYKIPAIMKNPAITPIAVDNFRSRMVSDTDLVDTAVNKRAMSFEQTLLKAFDEVNAKQQRTANDCRSGIRRCTRYYHRNGGSRHVAENCTDADRPRRKKLE